LRSRPFPPGEVSRGRGGAGRGAVGRGLVGEVLAGPGRGAEARRQCCFGDRAAAAAVTGAEAPTGAVATLGELPWGRWPLAARRRGGSDEERTAAPR
jgi:hypothetical protein